MSIVMILGGVAGLLFAVLMLLERNVKEFLVAAMIGSLMVAGGWFKLSEPSPAEKAEEARAQKFEQSTGITREQRRRWADLSKHQPKLSRLGPLLAESATRKLSETPATRHSDVRSLMFGGPQQVPGRDGVLYFEVRRFAPDLRGTLVAYCRFDDAAADWVVEAVEAKDFRTESTKVEHSGPWVADMAELHRLAVQIEARRLGYAP